MDIQRSKTLDKTGLQNAPLLQMKEFHVFTSLDSFKLPKGKESLKEPKTQLLKGTLDRTAQEIVKELKSKLRVMQTKIPKFSSQSMHYAAKSRPTTQNNGRRATETNSHVGPDGRRKTLMSVDTSTMNSDLAYKEDLELYLFKPKAGTKLLAFKKMNACEFPLRQIAAQQISIPQATPITRDMQLQFGFVLAFVTLNQIEDYLRDYGVLGQLGDDDNIVVSQLSKAIMNTTQYERKGRLKKKSLNSDNMKERHFVLEKDQLCYFKSDKTKKRNFNLITLSSATIKIYSPELPVPKHASTPDDVIKQYPYILEIENDTRKYVLAAKSHFDLEEWYTAILAQIESLKSNRLLSRNNQSVIQIERDIASRDQAQIKSLTKLQLIASETYQAFLLQFVNDAFITELLPSLTYYMTCAEQKNGALQAIEKAKGIIKHLKGLHNQAVAGIRNNGGGSTRGISSRTLTQSGRERELEPYKRYKQLSMEKKILCLICEEDLHQIDLDFAKMQKPPNVPNAEAKTPQELAVYQQHLINKALFSNTLSRIVRVLKYNYLPEFYKEQTQELTVCHAKNLPPLGFNSMQLQGANHKSLPDKTQTGKQANIFALLKNKKDNNPNIPKKISTLYGGDAIIPSQRNGLVSPSQSSTFKSTPRVVSTIKKVNSTKVVRSTGGTVVRKEVSASNTPEKVILEEAKSDGSTGASK